MRTDLLLIEAGYSSACLLKKDCSVFWLATPIQMVQRLCCILVMLFLQSEFLSQMGVTFKSASWLSLAIASGGAALLAILASFAIQRYRIRQEMHNEIHEIM